MARSAWLLVAVLSFAAVSAVLADDNDPFFGSSSESAKDAKQEDKNAAPSALTPNTDAAAPAKPVDMEPMVSSVTHLQTSVPSVEPFEPHPLERAFFADETKAKWSYDAADGSGPEYWPNLDKSFGNCSEESTAQSPLDLFTFRIASPMSPLLTPQYKAGQLLMRNTGNYLRLVPHKGSIMYWGDKIFELVYAQVHTPSEHHMSGEAFPIEVQFVHKSQDDDQMAVLSLLYKLGLSNPFIEKLIESAPQKDNEEEFVSGAVNLGDAIPKDITQYKAGTRVAYPHYTYEGSLTTPPCRENVRWFVWSKPDHISKDQVDALRRLVKSPSARPLQNVNGRVVELKTLF